MAKINIKASRKVWEETGNYNYQAFYRDDGSTYVILMDKSNNEWKYEKEGKVEDEDEDEVADEDEEKNKISEEMLEHIDSIFNTQKENKYKKLKKLQKLEKDYKKAVRTQKTLIDNLLKKRERLLKSMADKFTTAKLKKLNEVQVEIEKIQKTQKTFKRDFNKQYGIHQFLTEKQNKWLRNEESKTIAKKWIEQRFNINLKNSKNRSEIINELNRARLKISKKSLKELYKETKNKIAERFLNELEKRTKPLRSLFKTGGKFLRYLKNADVSGMLEDVTSDELMEVIALLF